MPAYEWDEENLEEAARWFVAQDRIETGLLSQLPELNNSIVSIAGPRLVTSEGFGCTSCHQIGTTAPVGTPLNSRGPDLSNLASQVRREWFNRWVRNPGRIQMGMEMPSIQRPVHGVLDDELDQQLAAVWEILNQPDFEPPRANPIRIVRLDGTSTEQFPKILTDVFQHGERKFVRPFVIGLPNRHSIMFDQETARLLHWWTGDIAREYTEGKTWYWETGGPSLLEQRADQPEWLVVDKGNAITPLRRGQNVTIIDTWQLSPSSVRYQYQLHFPIQGDEFKQIQIEEKISVLNSKTGETGFSRTISGLSNSSNHLLGMRIPHSATLVSRSDERIKFSIKQPLAATIEWVGNALEYDAESDFVAWPLNDSTPIRISYRTELPVDSWSSLRPIAKPKSIARLDVVPGFQATKLPFSEDWMPTALAWDPHGDLFVTSLKGRVWRVTDSDHDGIEDQADPLNVELAAPFGIAAYDSYLDVLNKYGLLRLRDLDRDGRFEDVSTIAGGWGYTADYHDWAVGLPRDAEGNYVIALSCQQDQRSPEAAKWRGKVLKLIPPTDRQSADRFTVKEISGGHRFPIGIAANASGEIFVTDNQGNYNPFNELNHVQAGARYGFINAMEDATQIRTPPSTPAINIPHPWTKSVNGICFLPRDGASARFGPFAGDLIGCEYDTRRLVRMSLESIGGQWQGAVYPFTQPLSESSEPLLGPLTCAVSPDGELYIGCIRDSGWGGANNIGNLVKLKLETSQLPSGIDEITATQTGLRLRFLRPVDQTLAKNPDQYTIHSFRRISTPQYGGPDMERRRETPSKIQVSQDGLEVRLDFEELREGFVYHVQIENIGSTDSNFFPAEAFYSMNRIPSVAD